ncbi:MAG TPA: vWA domain-containing protein [Pirellulaceae bacterium]|nr:vWA domain-containing protein [Pirellulaceae bacterium]
MSIFHGLRYWWQRRTGVDDSPLDGDASAFAVSFAVHMLLLIILGLFPVITPPEPPVILVSAATTPEELEQFQVPEEFYFNTQPSIDVGANSTRGQMMALSEAPIVSDVSIVPLYSDVVTDTTHPQIEVNNIVAVATGLHLNKSVAVKGAAGEGATGAVGAIDRLTHEILLSLEDRKTLVVWMFDQTASLIPQRQAIHDRFDKIYQELGIIEAAGAEAFKRHEDKPLLSSVVAFGKGLTLMTKDPTDSLEELKQAVKSIPNDNSGDENVFSAIREIARQNAEYRYQTASQSEPERNVMIVVFTDEAGSDERMLDEAVKMCRRWTMPVYVIGVPAPFGRRETMMKWVDPDPNYDQSAQWGVVDQGPESLMLERIKLGFSGQQEDEISIDSGFGPYALTRLCVETGGIYFAVHPNRDVRRQLRRGEVPAFSSYLQYFFDPESMRRYRPDYVSAQDYLKNLERNAARAALVKAAASSQIEQMADPRLRFVKRDEGAFATDLTTAQQAAAALEPKINNLYELLRKGEADREKEDIARWQAGYDLAMGRVLAVKVRTEGYNQILAAAKRGLKFKDAKNNTWVLTPSDEITVGSQMVKMAERAKMYLNRVVQEHPGTPWALLAERELKDPLGWKWKEEFTDLNPPRNTVAGNNAPAAAANDQKGMLKKPPPKRPPPKL